MRKVTVQDIRNKIRCPALNFVWLPFITFEQSSDRWLGRNDFNVRPRQPDHLPGTGNRSAGSITADIVIQSSLSKITEYFRPRGVAMESGVSLIFELLRHEPAVLCGQGFSDPDHAGRALGRRRQNQRRAHETHQPAPLYRE